MEQIDQDPSGGGMQNVDSGGIRAISIDYLESDGTTWVLVANQHSNPLCLTPVSGGGLQGCVDQYGKQLGESMVDSDGRNVRVFRFADGVLTPASGGTTFVSGLNGGPAQVAFSPDGRYIAVGLWGVPHLAALAEEPYQSPSRMYLYDANISDDGIEFENPRFYEESGVSGTIGFAWAPDNDFIYATNFNVSAEKSEYSVTALGIEDSAVFSSGGSRASGYGGIPGHGEEACWGWISQDGERFYAASFSQNSLSVFDIDGGQVTHRTSVVRRGDRHPRYQRYFHHPR